MLRLKIYANEKLEMPEMILEGINTIKLMTPYFMASPKTNKYTTAYGRVRRAARYAGLPMWGIINGKNAQNCAFFADQMVKENLAEWLEWHEEEFNPQKATSAERARHVPKGRNVDRNKKTSIAMKKVFQNISPERKAEWNAAKREGWRKRKERIEEEKKNQRKIDSGRLPKPGEIIPDWMKM